MNPKSPVIASLDEAVRYTKKVYECVCNWVNEALSKKHFECSRKAGLYTDSYSKANSQGQKMSLGSSWYVQKAWK